jgi:hypothetical protein
MVAAAINADTHWLARAGCLIAARLRCRKDKERPTSRRERGP